MRNGQMQDINIEIENSGAGGGYYVDTVGKNTKKIQEYIQNQLKEDQVAEQLQLEFEDPFTGNKK